MLANILRIKIPSQCLKLFVNRRLKVINRLGYSTFSAKDFIVHDSHDVGTLTTRFVKYLALQKCKVDNLVPQKINYSDFYPVTDLKYFNSSLQQIPTDQIQRLIINTYTYKSNGDPMKVAQVINKIDELCVNRIVEMDRTMILNILYSFMFLIPNKITKLDFYQQGIDNLVKNFDAMSSKEEFVEISFYVGLGKKTPQNTELMRILLKAYLSNYLHSLNEIDLSIVSNAAFKTSVLHLGGELSTRLEQEVLNLDSKDDSILITLIKSLRLNRIKSDKVCEKLKEHLIVGKFNNYDFKGLIHIFAYFAEGRWNDPEVCSMLITTCMDKLDKIGIDGKIFNDARVKDIATFLWCCAQLSTRNLLQKKDYKFLEKHILNRYERQEYNNCPDELIDSVLSLWMLGYKSQDLISIGQSLTINSGRRQDRVKLDSRYRLLLNCVQIEHPQWLKKNLNRNAFNINKKAPEFLLKNRPNLKKVFEIWNDNRKQYGIKLCSITTPVDEINIAGIYSVNVHEDESFIEVFEDHQVLKFEDKPIALVDLKIKLMEKMGYRVYTVKPNECGASDVLNHILEKAGMKRGEKVQNLLA